MVGSTYWVNVHDCTKSCYHAQAMSMRIKLMKGRGLNSLVPDSSSIWSRKARKLGLNGIHALVSKTLRNIRSVGDWRWPGDTIAADMIRLYPFESPRKVSMPKLKKYKTRCRQKTEDLALFTSQLKRITSQWYCCGRWITIQNLDSKNVLDHDYNTINIIGCLLWCI